MYKDTEAWKCIVCLEAADKFMLGKSAIWSWTARVGILGPTQLCHLLGKSFSLFKL